ncbi:SDR family oxidoreductase [Paenibacillus marinisediminis]
MSNYVVTGGAGFIGSNLVEALLLLGHDVKVLDNFSTGKRENLAHLLEHIELIEGDIRDLDTCVEAVKGADYVLHQAALGSVPRSIEDPIATHQHNVDGTLNMLVAAKDAGVQKVVMASSSSAYGNAMTTAKSESLPPAPLSPYAVSKVATEYYAAVFHSVYGLETICLRYFNVFGARQDPYSQYAAVIPRFVKAMLENRSPDIYGNGMQSRDFTYIDNVVQANLLACHADSEASGKVFNIACGEQISINELYRQLSKLLGSSLQPQYRDARQGDVQHSLADIQLAKQCLGYEPQVTFSEGLQRAVTWYQQHWQQRDSHAQAVY